MSLEHKLEEAFDNVTAPAQLKWNTLAAIEARRVAVSDAAAATEAAGETMGSAKTASSQSQAKTRSRIASAWWKFALPIAACFVLALVGVVGIGGLAGGNSGSEEPAATDQAEQTGQAESAAPALTPLEQAVAYVGIDVNPSLELALSEQDTVITAEAKNTDAEGVLAALDLSGLPYDQALATLFASESMAPYLANDALVEISVTTDDQVLAQTLVAQSDQALAQLPCVGNCQQVDDATRVAAHDAGMGVGKYQVATELVELDSGYTMDDCSHMSMRQLHDAVNHHHAQAAASASSTTQSQSQGQGYGQGQGYAQNQSTPQYGHHNSGHGSTHHYE